MGPLPLVCLVFSDSYGKCQCLTFLLMPFFGKIWSQTTDVWPDVFSVFGSIPMHTEAEEAIK